jgi:predicted transcriptional regulator
MAMLFKVDKNWKEYLSPEDEERLNDILKKVQKYRGAYSNAEEVKMAQLWCAILELRKENAALLRKLQKIDYIFNGLVDRIKKQMEEDRQIIESLEKF